MGQSLLMLTGQRELTKSVRDKATLIEKDHKLDTDEGHQNKNILMELKRISAMRIPFQGGKAIYQQPFRTNTMVPNLPKICTVNTQAFNQHKEPIIRKKYLHTKQIKIINIAKTCPMRRLIWPVRVLRETAMASFFLALCRMGEGLTSHRPAEGGIMVQRSKNALIVWPLVIQ
jgi:hypothetical protein